MIKRAEFSPDRVYRYTLERIWGDENDLMLSIGLNPSTADEFVEDPTVRRDMGFAHRMGFGGMVKMNIFAFRNTYPETLKGIDNPVGKDNNAALIRMCEDKRIKVVVCCWGNGGELNQRGWDVARLLVPYHQQCYGVTQMGHPKHVLYIPYNTPLQPFFSV